MTQAAPYVAELCRFYVLVTLLVAAAGKAAAPHSFEQTVVALVPVQRWLVRSAAAGIVCTECAIALSLMAGGQWTRTGMTVAIILFLAFTGVILTALIQRCVVGCNCFGVSTRAISIRDLFRNATLIAACGYYLGHVPPAPSLALATRVALAGIAAILFLISIALDKLVPPAPSPPPTLPIGQRVPPFEAPRRSDGRRLTSAEISGQPLILAFLSSGCPACREKMAELRELVPAMHGAGVALWIVGADSVHGMTSLLHGWPLPDQVLFMDPAMRRKLNPRGAAPFYVFLDENMVVRASSFIGDEDWQNLVNQMRDFAALERAVERAPRVRRARRHERL